MTIITWALLGALVFTYVSGALVIFVAVIDIMRKRPDITSKFQLALALVWPVCGWVALSILLDEKRKRA